ncbi:MAG: CDP-alcohol phosphatidyltransferase family protein [Acidimicrobiaceae bacterium]|nr:CDP-alcohol phosphatidyltransferase family protein [Acidimicrobiaceae bacterium]MCY4280956.1 CDP-alcohol phosphatidyltransferase family protein [Acidimicrobiaceae bacterium]MCY4295152.1 CDP-alcohol phosphatidyltransferase family protein [Acidimicrobiaceae bacterium]
MAAPRTGEDRVLTVPNLISAARLLCVPLFLWMLFGWEDRWAAALLWGALGATDWVDGWWARRFDSVSRVGKLLDPITDRAVLFVCVIAAGVDGSVPWWLVLPALIREGLVAVVGLVLLSLGARPIEVTWWGKCATFGLYICFPLLLAGASDLAVADGFRIAGWVCAAPSLFYSYLSAAQYIPLGRESLRRGRAERRQQRLQQQQQQQQRPQ